ncbi:MAG: hypothetical protein ACRDNG_10855, partial [Gaiellaceae bacterium]
MPDRRSIFRLLALAGFLLTVALALWLAELRPLLVIVVMAVALLVAWAIEWLSWRQDVQRLAPASVESEGGGVPFAVPPPLAQPAPTATNDDVPVPAGDELVPVEPPAPVPVPPPSPGPLTPPEPAPPPAAEPVETPVPEPEPEPERSTPSAPEPVPAAPEHEPAAPSRPPLRPVPPP